MNDAKPRQSYSVVPGNIPNQGILFVDHQQNKRSGHGGNCLVQCANGDIVSFYSNVSGDIWNGHSVAGWTEYKISQDLGETWSQPMVLDYSKKAWEEEEVYSALVFGVNIAPNGTLVAVAARFAEPKWIKQAPPVALLSYDHGRTWSEPREIDASCSVQELALTFDTTFVDGDQLYYVFFGDSANMGYGHYSLYVSKDNGKSFNRRSTLPFAPTNYYSAAAVLADGRFIVYSYPYNGQETDEHNLPYVISEDKGRTWSAVQTAYFAKKLRNPQMSARVGDRYFMHGRSGSYGAQRGNFVLYSSTNGVDWDEGTILCRGSSGTDCYSGNAIIRSSDSQKDQKLLIQSSIGYDEDTARVNARQWWVVPLV